MKMTSSIVSLKEQDADALIVFFQEETPLLPETESVVSLAKMLMASSSFKGKAGQTAIFPLCSACGMGARRLILAGLGAARDFHRGVLEKAAAAAVRVGKDAGAHQFAMAASLSSDMLTAAEYQLIAGRGAAWGTYAFTRFKSDPQEETSFSLVFVGEEADAAAIATAEGQGRALTETADLANLPGNEASPSDIAEWAKSMARRNRLVCQVLDEEDLEAKGCGALLSVARGSATSAKMVILRHTGSDPSAKPIVLVGKTVTFDSGGISLKPGKGMGWMRYDKSGGMAVLAAMQMIARMELKTPVIGILGAVENMPGSLATRPGDVVTAYNGKTIEILNTDAEGRLVLADALAMAAEMNPRAVVDIATLTGAVIVALGSAAAAVLGNDETLIDALRQSADQAGERLWPLPLYKEYGEEMKSDFADICNLCKSGGAGTATAAAFLQSFVPEEIPWAHIDIAGTAWEESAKPHQAPGATLFGARLMAQWAASQM